jgi:hypothetical protein
VALRRERERADRDAEIAGELGRRRTALSRLWPRGLEAAEAEIAGRSRSELESDRSESLALAQRLEAELATARDARTLARQALEEAGRGQAELTRRAQDAQLKRQALIDRAEEHALLLVARHLVLEAQRQNAQRAAPLLARASGLFQELTAGEYVKLALAREAGGAILIAEHRSGIDRTSHELSAGTLDQIWLALRLAAVEDAAETTPLPLLLDDVLVHFDDPRSAATLRTLARLSERVQVVLFTHHDHVLHLAREHVGDALTEVVLARPESPSGTRRGPMTRIERQPAPEAAWPSADEAIGGATAIDADRIILHILGSAGGGKSKADIVDLARAEGHEIESAWSSAIQRLKRDELVVQTGEKKGARYSLAGTGEPS